MTDPAICELVLLNYSSGINYLWSVSSFKYLDPDTVNYVACIKLRVKIIKYIICNLKNKTIFKFLLLIFLLKKTRNDEIKRKILK